MSSFIRQSKNFVKLKEVIVNGIHVELEKLKEDKWVKPFTEYVKYYQCNNRKLSNLINELSIYNLDLSSSFWNLSISITEISNSTGELSICT